MSKDDVILLMGEIRQTSWYGKYPTVDGRNPTNQLKLVVFPIIYNVYTSFRWFFRRISEPSTVATKIDSGQTIATSHEFWAPKR